MTEQQPDTKADLPSCAEIMKLGQWTRIPGDELRWRWAGSAETTVQELLGEEADIQRFPSVDRQEAIHVLVCSDGGVISYQRKSGQWLHTLNSLSAFRYRIYELNLVPIAELGELLHRNVE